MVTRLHTVAVLAVLLAGVSRAEESPESVLAEVVENLQANYLQPLDHERLLCNAVLALRGRLPTLGIFFPRDRKAVRLAFDDEELLLDLDDLDAPGALAARLAEVLEFVGDEEITGDEDEPRAEQAQAYAMISGLLRGLGDPHTVFLPPAVYRKLSRSGDPGFADIGISVKCYGDALVVAAVRRFSPAQRAGIEPGELILAVNGHPARSLSRMEVVAAMWGPTGTAVTLRLGDSMDNERDILVVRQHQFFDEVRVKRMRNNVLVVRIAAFAQGVASSLEALLSAEERRGPVRGIVLDLRENPGGFLSEGVELLELFLPGRTLLVRVAGADHARDEEHRTARRSGHFRTVPMILLVDGQSASVTELCARALQAHHRALLVGERSFGKGTVQSLFELSDGSALKMTVARYLGPHGRPLEHGIDPDVPIDEVDARDRPLEFALSVLQRATSARLPLLKNVARSLANRWRIEGK